MKCIILAAGEGIRMRPLTDDNHKSMLLLLEKPIMEHIFESLPNQITEVILVVGYMQDRIRGYFGNKWKELSISYVIQEEKSGTYKALEICRPLLGEGERFMMMYADDLHDPKGLEKCLDLGDSCMLVTEADEPRKFGVIELQQDEWTIKSIEEKPENPKSNLVAVGVQVLDTMVFKYPARQHASGEYYLTDSIAQMIEDGHPVKIVRSNFWLPIGYPEDIIRAEEVLKSR